MTPDPIRNLQSSLARTAEHVKAACEALERLQQAQATTDDGEVMVQAYERRAQAIATGAHAAAFAELMIAAGPVLVERLPKITVAHTVPGRLRRWMRSNAELEHCRLLAAAARPLWTQEPVDLVWRADADGDVLLEAPECLVLRADGQLAWFHAKDVRFTANIRAAFKDEYYELRRSGRPYPPRTTVPLLDERYVRGLSYQHHRCDAGPSPMIVCDGPLVWPETWPDGVAMQFDVLTAFMQKRLTDDAVAASRKADEIRQKRQQYGL